MRPQKLGDYIRALRVQNGLTQAELAEQLHLTDKAVSKWERNLPYPDISLMPKLADVLGVTVSDLICEMDDGGSPSRLLQVIQMSNDIRSPVHVILGCGELVDRFSDDPQKRKRYLDGIRVSAQYLLEQLERIRRVANESGIREQAEEAGYIQMEGADSTPMFYDFSGKRILVADDSEINRQIAGAMLERTGADVEFAEDGLICVEKVDHAPANYYNLITVAERRKQYNRGRILHYPVSVDMADSVADPQNGIIEWIIREDLLERKQKLLLSLSEQESRVYKTVYQDGETIAGHWNGSGEKTEKQLLTHLIDTCILTK